MDGIRGEVSNKIRSAIKAKLMELGAYVDDELPDYIMVMVANKRSRQQMEEDLQLFLGDSTSTFTSWLHTVLSKLQQVTVNSTELKKGSDKKRLASEDHKKEKRKKLKKEKPDRLEKSPEKVITKVKEAEVRSVEPVASQSKSKQIKSEPVDLAADEDSLLIDSAPNSGQSSNPPAAQQRKVSASKGNDEEDDDDFINLKADVETDMWGEGEETTTSAVVKSANVTEKRVASMKASETRTLELRGLEAQVKLPNPSEPIISRKAPANTIPLEEGTTSIISSSSKTATADPKPAPRIIRISETIREEQETLKPSSKVVRDPQKREERSPPSPIIFSSNTMKSKEKIGDDVEVFARHIAEALRKMTLKQRKLAKLKIQQAIHDCRSSEAQVDRNTKQHIQDLPHTAHNSKKTSSSKVKRLRDRSRERRRRRKKCLELAAEKGRQSDSKLDGMRNRFGGTLQSESKKKKSPIRFGSLRMDSPSLSRSRTYYSSSHSSSNDRCGECSTSVRDQSPTPPRTIGSVALAKRVFQSHIVSQRKAQDEEKSRRRTSSSLTTESRSRRGDQRSNRKHEQQDLRETLRKERQKEREHDRNRERDQRRSREQSRARKSQSGVSNLARSSSSHRDENEPDPTLASVVRVKPRPQIPAALQANRSLILKAVAEAQKSVSKVVVRPELSIKKSPMKQHTVKKSVKDRLQTRKMINIKSPPLQKHQSIVKQSACLPSRETLKKMSFTVHAKGTEPSEEPLIAEFGDASDEGSINLDPSVNILIQVPASPAVEDSHGPPDPIQSEKVRRWIKDVEEATKSDAPPEISTDIETEADTYAGLETTSKHASDGDSEEFDDALEVDTASLKTSDIHSVVLSEDQSLKQSAGTQFVVTLDGLDPMLLRSFALDSDHQVRISSKQQIHSTPADNQDDENLLRDELVKEQLLRQELLRQQAAVRKQKAVQRPTIAVSPVTAPVNAAVKRPASPSCTLESRPPKVNTAVAKSLPAERCKFWPTCKNGDKCEFHHPNVPCKLFPNCKFSDRCLYIHPNCRFNTACTRTDCPYTHTGPRGALSAAPVGPSHAGNQTIKQACKYFPNCSNLSCPFIHPTVCKFGTHCTKPKCQFIHSDKGLITKHKWVRH